MTTNGIGRTRIPVTAAWGIRLAIATAVISGFSVWLNATGQKQFTDQVLYTTLKNLVAALILVAGAWAMGGAAEARRLDRRQWASLALVGLIGGSIPFALFFTGLSMEGAAGAAFIQKTLFVWVAILAVPFLGERLGALQVGALVVLLGGTLLTSSAIDLGGSPQGALLIAAATGFWAVEVILVKRLLGGIPPAVVGAARLGIGVVLLGGFLLVTGRLGAIAGVSGDGWSWVVLTGILLAGYVGTWFAALRRAPASAVSAVLVIGAVITAVLQWVANGKAPTETAGAGMVVLLAAATVVAWGALRPAAPATVGVRTQG